MYIVLSSGYVGCDDAMWVGCAVGIWGGDCGWWLWVKCGGGEHDEEP